MALNNWLHPSVEWGFPFLGGMMAQLPLAIDRVRNIPSYDLGNKYIRSKVDGSFIDKKYANYYT